MKKVTRKFVFFLLHYQSDWLLCNSTCIINDSSRKSEKFLVQFEEMYRNFCAKIFQAHQLSQKEELK